MNSVLQQCHQSNFIRARRACAAPPTTGTWRAGAPCPSHSQPPPAPPAAIPAEDEAIHDRSRSREHPGLVPEDQSPQESTCDYGPGPQVPPVHAPPQVSSPPQPKRLKFEDPSDSPGPDPGASSSSGATGPILPIAGPALPIAQPAAGLEPEKKDESGDESDRTQDYHQDNR